MAICSECHGTLWTRVMYVSRYVITNFDRVPVNDGAIWQCNKCKRIIHYSGWDGSPTLPADDKVI